MQPVGYRNQPPCQCRLGGTARGDEIELTRPMVKQGRTQERSRDESKKQIPRPPSSGAALKNPS